MKADKISDNHLVTSDIGQITSNLPETEILSEMFGRVKPFLLTDPIFQLPGPIDVLIDGQLFPHILTGENSRLGKHFTFIVGSKFGLLVMGQAPH